VYLLQAGTLGEWVMYGTGRAWAEISKILFEISGAAMRMTS